ncbi:MAG TPA: ATP synthase F1 subunit epsilon [Bryobacteraceae bacterium]|jgi:F-type H+-transporting ATPase subunit epsilon
MADTFLLEIATPERQLLKEQVTEAQIPGEDGYMGILPGHAPLVSRLKPGILSYHLNGIEQAVAIHSGFLEVAQDHVRVLVDGGVKREDVDPVKAAEQYRLAQQKVENIPAGMDPADAIEEAMRAEALVELAKRPKP